MWKDKMAQFRNTTIEDKTNFSLNPLQNYCTPKVIMLEVSFLLYIEL